MPKTFVFSSLQSLFPTSGDPWSHQTELISKSTLIFREFLCKRWVSPWTSCLWSSFARNYHWRGNLPCNRNQASRDRYSEKFCCGSFRWRKSSKTCFRCCSWNICKRRQRFELASRIFRSLKAMRCRFAQWKLSVQRAHGRESWIRKNRWEGRWSLPSDSKYFCHDRYPVFWWSALWAAIAKYFLRKFD